MAYDNINVSSVSVTLLTTVLTVFHYLLQCVQQFQRFCTIYNFFTTHSKENLTFFPSCSGTRRNKIFRKVYVLAFRFLSPSFFFFTHLSAAVIDLLLGLLSVEQSPDKASSRPWSFSKCSGLVEGNFASSFSIK